MNCPLCIDQTLESMHRQGVEIDVCPKCRGVWLDRGELDRLAADPDTSPRRDRDRGRNRDDRDDDRERDRDRSKKRRKKSLAYRIGDALEDVLDF